MDLWKGKIAVVTGASSGIGAAIAVALSREGLNVIGLARRLERVEKLAKENASNPGKITAHKCDVSDLESIKAAFAWIKEKFGRVDILINNAGLVRMSKILTDEENEDDIVTIINTNLVGAILVTKEGFKLMKDTGDYGYIINISSTMAHQASVGPETQINVYSGSKFGLRAVSDVLRHELIGLKNDKIRISSISPGFVNTEIISAAGLPEMEETLRNNPHQESEDIADHVLFLLSRKPHIHIKDIIVQAVGEK